MLKSYWLLKYQWSVSTHNKGLRMYNWTVPNKKGACGQYADSAGLCNLAVWAGSSLFIYGINRTATCGKSTFGHVHPTKTQINLRIHAVWSVSSLSAWRNFTLLVIQNSAQWRFWSDCANAQADLTLRWAHMTEGTFSEVDNNNNIFKLPYLLYIFGQTGLSKQRRPRSLQKVNFTVWEDSWPRPGKRRHYGRRRLIRVNTVATHPIILRTFKGSKRDLLKKRFR